MKHRWMKQIGHHYADVQKIWELSAASKGRNAHAINFVGRCEVATEEGKLTFEACLKLEDLVRPQVLVLLSALLSFSVLCSDSDALTV